MIRRTFLAAFAVLAMAASANAGTMYVWAVLDPVTTAGAGVAGIPGPRAQDTQFVSSSRTGTGTYHIYAVDDTTGSAGIRSFFIKVNNSTAGNNRAPQTTWDTDPSFGDGTISTAGFDTSRAAPPTLNGSQGNPPSAAGTTVPQIDGFGISASSMSAKITGEGSFNTYGNLAGQTVSPQWGLYPATEGLTTGVVAASGNVRSAIFLGEGTYAVGTPVVIDITTTAANGGTIVNSWNATGFPGQGSFATASDTPANSLSNVNPFGAVIPEPATMTLIGLALVGFSGLAGRRRS